MGVNAQRPFRRRPEPPLPWPPPPPTGLRLAGEVDEDVFFSRREGSGSRWTSGSGVRSTSTAIGALPRGPPAPWRTCAPRPSSSLELSSSSLSSSSSVVSSVCSSELTRLEPPPPLTAAGAGPRTGPASPGGPGTWRRAAAAPGSWYGARGPAVMNWKGSTGREERKEGAEAEASGWATQSSSRDGGPREARARGAVSDT